MSEAVQRSLSVCIVAPVSSINDRTRLSKFADAYDSSGATVTHWAWERGGRQAASASNPARRVLLSGGGYHSRLGRLLYPLWGLVVFVASLTRDDQEVYHALGLESALPLLIGLRFRRSPARVIFDDADRFSMTHKLPTPILRFVRRLERWTATQSDVVVVPGLTRYRDGILDEATVAVLPNHPSEDALRAARVESLRLDEAWTGLTLYANGWVGPSRGASQLLELARHFQAEPTAFRIVVAGRLEGTDAHTLSTLPNVEYLGQIDNSSALAQYRRADLVFTFYDPSIQINRFAEPNKWGDCLAFSTPFVVNSEVETAGEWIGTGAALAVPWNDIKSLIGLCHAAIDDPSILDAAAARMTAVASSDLISFGALVQERILGGLQ